MTHGDLVKRAERWLRGTGRCAVVFTEPVVFKLNEVPDAIGFEPSGRSVVIECKTSRANFLSDKNKPSRRAARSLNGHGLGQERWYLVEPGTINLRPEAPEGCGGLGYGDALHGWGVLELVNGRVYRRRDPCVRHCEPSKEAALLVAVCRRAEGYSQLNIRLPEELAIRFKSMAEQAGLSRAEIVRRLIEIWLSDPRLTNGSRSEATA